MVVEWQIREVLLDKIGYTVDLLLTFEITAYFFAIFFDNRMKYLRNSSLTSWPLDQSGIFPPMNESRF